MKKPKISSVAAAESPRPWFRLEVVDGNPDFTIVEANGLPRFRRHLAEKNGENFTATMEQAVDATMKSQRGRRFTPGLNLSTRPTPGPPPEAGRPNLSDEVHVVAMTLDGGVEFVPASQQRATYYAHLAWYDPLTREWTVLDFVEDQVIAPPVPPVPVTAG